MPLFTISKSTRAVYLRPVNIKNIVFDYGGVLVDWNPRYLYKDLFGSEGEMEYFLENICSSAWNEQQDAGRPLDVATQELQQKYPEHQALIQRYYDDWEVMLKDEIPENTRLIKPLKSRNFKLYGLSNWSGETFPIAYDRFDFFKELDGMIISGNEKMMKPQKEIYFLLMDRFNLKAEESVFIDDNAKNIEVAKELDFQTIHFNGSVNLEKELQKMNII